MLCQGVRMEGHYLMQCQISLCIMVCGGGCWMEAISTVFYSLKQRYPILDWSRLAIIISALLV